MKRTLEERIIAFICLLALVGVLAGWATTALAAMVVVELQDLSEYTVIHVRETSAEGVRYYGYHDSGVYPTIVSVDLRPGSSYEYRLGKECTVLNPATGETVRVKEGARQKPCVWTDWMPVPIQMRPIPPKELST